jgi:mono/diheme cytochrome c family protein
LQGHAATSTIVRGEGLPETDPDSGETAVQSVVRGAAGFVALLVPVLSTTVGTAFAQVNAGPAEATPSPAAEHHDQDFADKVRPFLARHCLECHGIDEPKGDLRLDRLSRDFTDAASREQWRTALKRIAAGEMPPESQPRPSADEVRAFSDWVNARARAAEAADRAAQGRAVLRRLNRVEYENTICDLLGVKIELQELLPVDTSAHGFDNVGEALHVSSFLMERYLEAADTALNVAIANAPQPELVSQRYRCEDERHVKSTTERVFRQIDDALVCFSSSAWQAITLGQFYPRDRGTYRFRISASGFQSDGKPVVFRVDAGPMLMGTKNHLVDYFAVPADEPTIVEFVEDQEARSTIRLLPYGLASAQSVDKVGADEYTGAGLAIQWIEVEGPLHDAWPPESHRRLFGELAQAPVPKRRERLEVVSDDPLPDAERILRSFARRAFRRTVTDDDVQPFVALVADKLAEDYSFEQAVRVGLKGMLVSPEFLFLRERPGRLDDFALASRLSYFLWSTMPDEELFALAGQGALAEPDTLRRQVERMLGDRRARALTENFAGQWLGLRDIDFTEPDHRLYPEFDDMLKAAMVKEAHLFFNEVLKNDLSVTSFVASDFTLLNERLAEHYGIEGVEGPQFRKVALPPDSHRGGVLTMAAVLKVTANGTTTSPVVRGAWVLDRIVGTPPPPPPGGVPAVDPDIRGATTIREQLAKHREIESCASCHAKIDPPGFALESFDVIGGWRENYRSVGKGEAVTVKGRRMPYHKGPPVDPGDVLADGRPFADIDGFRQLLLEDQDQITRNLTRKLLTYATGQPPAEADQAEVDAIVERLRDRNYGLRSLVHEIVQSEAFRNK